MTNPTSDPRHRGDGAGAKVSGPTGDEGTTGRFPDTLAPTVDAAEVAYLGALILNPDARLEIDQLVGPGDFQREAHRQVFVAIRDLHAAGHPVDVVTVSDRLATTGHLDEVGGPVAVADLCDLRVCPSPASHVVYGVIVAREARRRRGIKVLREAIARLEAGEDPAVVAQDLRIEVAA